MKRHEWPEREGVLLLKGEQRLPIGWLLAGVTLILAFFACSSNRQDAKVDDFPPIYPDYVNITIPYNIAPLNFLLRDSPVQISRTEVTLKGTTQSLRFTGKRKIQFPQKQWKKFLLAETGNKIIVTVKTKHKGVWTKYQSFEWMVVRDGVDPYLTYRLIEPGYEVWNKIQLCERNVENFSVRVFADNNLYDKACMNCHIPGNQNPHLTFFHLRGEKGGTILNKDGKLRKINTRTKEMIGAATYGHFHPSGRYGVFSTNIVIPQFHTLSPIKLEVFDDASDIVVVDFDNNRIISSPMVNSDDRFETFPCFSADGQRIYFCTAPSLSLPENLRQLKYSLCAIDFDAEQGLFGHQIDTIVKMSGKQAGSVSFPRPSADGRFLLYCLSDYGTFPVWHPETDLVMLDLQTGKNINMDAVNSHYSDTYHAWSSNSRWFVFASKRDDGWYGKPYFAYVDEEATVHKPFVLPQHDPSFYDYTFKSFNIPELMTGKLPFSASDIEKLYRKGKLETFK